MAAGDPAFKNETLKDKITYPFSKDAHDETEARRLADNYLHYREDKTKELEASQEAREAKEAKEGGGSKPPGWGGGGDTKTIVHQVPALAAGATRGGPQGSGAKQEALAERAPRMGKEMKEEW